MPILNRDKEHTILPALDELQECDECGAQQVGHDLWFSYPPGNQPCRVLCGQCFYTPPNQRLQADAETAGALDGENNKALRR